MRLKINIDCLRCCSVTFADKEIELKFKISDVIYVL